jgi:hypothetical protein
MPKKVKLIVVGGAVFLTVLFIGMLATVRTPGQVASNQTPDFFGTAIADFQNALNTPGLSPEEQRHYETKLRNYSIEATLFAGPDWPVWAPGPNYTTPPTRDIVVVKDPDGISPHPNVAGQIPGIGTNHGEYAFNNSWKKTYPDRDYRVVAGGLTSDPSQGLVIVADSIRIFFNIILTPRRSGAVRIVAERGPYLELAAENGDVFYFDPLGERFVESLRSPTLTPQPTFTPTPETYPYP